MHTVLSKHYQVKTSKQTGAGELLLADWPVVLIQYMYRNKKFNILFLGVLTKLQQLQILKLNESRTMMDYGKAL